MKLKFIFFWCAKIWHERYEEFIAVGVSLGLSCV